MWYGDLICVSVTSRAGSGHFFSGPGRVRAGLFWPGSGSGWPFLATGQFGPPILAYFGPFLTNFSAKSAIFLVRAGSGHPKSGPGRVGPLKTHGPRAKFRVGLWPDPALAAHPIMLEHFQHFYLLFIYIIW